MIAEIPRTQRAQVSFFSHLIPDHIWAAGESNACWKLIAEVTPQGGTVEAVRLPKSHPLAG